MVEYTTHDGTVVGSNPAKLIIFKPNLRKALWKFVEKKLYVKSC